MTTPIPQPQNQSPVPGATANISRRAKRISGRVQAAVLQRFAYDSAMALKDDCTSKETGKLSMDVKTAVAVQKLIGAWDTATDRYRIARGKGLPASVKANPKGKARRSVEPEPIEPEPMI